MSHFPSVQINAFLKTEQRRPRHACEILIRVREFRSLISSGEDTVGEERTNGVIFLSALAAFVTRANLKNERILPTPLWYGIELAGGVFFRAVEGGLRAGP